MLPKDINNLKDIGLFGYSDDENGNIEIGFHIEEPGDYKLILSEKDLESMERMSFLGKTLKNQKVIIKEQNKNE